VAIECGGPEASNTLEQLVEGKAVSLVPDPTQDAVDRYGRSLFYVDRADGLDVGEEMIRRGWSKVYVYDQPFQRLPQYRDAQNAAHDGVWSDCRGNFHLNEADEQRDSAKEFVELYYRRISNDQYLSAWRMLGARRKAQVRPYSRWKGGYRSSRGVTVLSARARLAGARRAVVSVRLRSRDRDVCNNRTVRQSFAGNVILAPDRDSWLIVKFQMRKTGGKTPRLSESQCPVVGGGEDGDEDGDEGGEPETGCHPSYTPCVPAGQGDLDCADIGHPVQVIGPDDYGLDGNDDGVGCES
jgi:hypothetical protein